jgi:hypothetical protein
MSLLDDAVDRIQRAMTKRIDATAPFMATVTNVTSAGVTIQRDGPYTADAQPYANTTGVVLNVGQRVICTPINGTPFVSGVVSAPQPKSQSSAAGGTYTSAGTYEILNAGAPFATWSDLNPARAYQLDADLMFIITGTGTNPRGVVGCRFVGTTTTDIKPGTYADLATSRLPVNYHARALGIYPDVDGNITATPILQWTSGSVQVVGVYMTPTLV